MKREDEKEVEVEGKRNAYNDPNPNQWPQTLSR